VLKVRAVQRVAVDNTVIASSNETPCFAALASAFRGSHSNTYLVYTECGCSRGQRTASRRLQNA
jgi:hypothetical protein